MASRASHRTMAGPIQRTPAEPQPGRAARLLAGDAAVVRSPGPRRRAGAARLDAAHAGAVCCVAAPRAGGPAARQWRIGRPRAAPVRTLVAGRFAAGPTARYTSCGRRCGAARPEPGIDGLCARDGPGPAAGGADANQRPRHAGARLATAV